MRVIRLLLKALAFVVLDPARRETPPGRQPPERPPRRRRCPVCRRERKRGGICSACYAEVQAGD